MPLPAGFDSAHSLGHSVVDEHINLTVGLDGLIHDGLNLRIVADVALESHCVAAVFFDIFYDPLNLREGPANVDDFSPFMTECIDKALADSLTSASDNCDFSFQNTHNAVPFLCSICIFV